ncbi:CLUMA_CG019746, isoform A [Clunio marinus]|uniref:CLUMA_CG019746, isoform A n=1 Tax=Clunio marinus TaxID=568069 RepID=A0A1J1J369_9DIPT|nr:CLUMA_CG019746, isoform A [Clunio marinus]
MIYVKAIRLSTDYYLALSSLVSFSLSMECLRRKTINKCYPITSLEARADLSFKLKPHLVKKQLQDVSQ